jgi:hypothetical protein
LVIALLLLVEARLTLAIAYVLLSALRFAAKEASAWPFLSVWRWR